MRQGQVISFCRACRYVAGSVTLRKMIHTNQQKILQSLLRKLRLERGLRQQDLGRKLGGPQSFVSKYEAGERRLDFLELREICVVLEISLAEFVNRFEEELDAAD